MLYISKNDFNFCSNLNGQDKDKKRKIPNLQPVKKQHVYCNSSSQRHYAAYVDTLPFSISEIWVFVFDRMSVCSLASSAQV